MNETVVHALADDKWVIFNRRKLQAITDNDWRMIELYNDFGSFQTYLHKKFQLWVRSAVTTG